MSYPKIFSGLFILRWNLPTLSIEKNDLFQFLYVFDCRTLKHFICNYSFLNFSYCYYSCATHFSHLMWKVKRKEHISVDEILGLNSYELFLVLRIVYNKLSLLMKTFTFWEHNNLSSDMLRGNSMILMLSKFSVFISNYSPLIFLVEILDRQFVVSSKRCELEFRISNLFVIFPFAILSVRRFLIRAKLFKYRIERERHYLYQRFYFYILIDLSIISILVKAVLILRLIFRNSCYLKC